MTRKSRKTTRYISQEELVAIVRETRLKAEAKAKKDDECLGGKCKHDECKPPRTRAGKHFGQRSPRDEPGSNDNAIRLIEESE